MEYLGFYTHFILYWLTFPPIYTKLVLIYTNFYKHKKILGDYTNGKNETNYFKQLITSYANVLHHFN